MSKQITNQDQKGFTIIEVLIVLAIAALILLVVFLAIPGLQRSQRNSARKSDVGRMTTGIANYVANNNGSQITTQANCTTAMTDAGTTTQFKLISSACGNQTGTAGTGSPTVVDAFAPTNATPGIYFYTPFTTPAPNAQLNAAPTGSIAYLFPGYVCPATTGGSTIQVTTTGASSSSVAIAYANEGTSAFTWSCVNAG